MARIAVLGMGVVGFPTALMLSRTGEEVIGVDINKDVVSSLNKGKLPQQVKEEQLETIFKEQSIRKNLHFQQRPAKADIFIIAVPTPLDHRNKADLSFVKKAAESIVSYLKNGDLVIVESTVPPLTCRNFITPILERNGLVVGESIFLAHCPERVLPGRIYHELIHNDRIIGGMNEKTCMLATRLYLSFVKGTLYKTDDITAEYCKLMENAFRDVNIALANEFASVAERLGVDAKEAIKLANKHPRVNILNPGIGVGGHCIPIDPWFINEVDPKNSRLVSMARKINKEMPAKIAAKIKKAVKTKDNPKIVAIGAAYKPNTADIRESPAIEVVRLLRKVSLNVAHFDPLVDGYKWPKTLIDACQGADLLVILVPHGVVLKELNDNRLKIKTNLKNPHILEF